ncbi:hypothetical protein V1281_001319 [Nitrobacteraceae bacterium AZCC 2161]
MIAARPLTFVPNQDRSSPLVRRKIAFIRSSARILNIPNSSSPITLAIRASSDAFANFYFLSRPKRRKVHASSCRARRSATSSMRCTRSTSRRWSRSAAFPTRNSHAEQVAAPSGAFLDRPDPVSPLRISEGDAKARRRECTFARCSGHQGQSRVTLPCCPKRLPEHAGQRRGASTLIGLAGDSGPICRFIMRGGVDHV